MNGILRISTLLFAYGCSIAGSTFITQAAEIKYGPLPFPVVNADTWVLIELWPTVQDITLSAFFLNASSRKNENLCQAAKVSLDRDAKALAEERRITAAASRECYTLRDAIAKGYITENAP